VQQESFDTLRDVKQLRGPEYHMPKVSVIIITYNRANFLLEAVRSVLSQTYTDFELIIVDDASQDNTAQVVDGLSDKRIRYIRHEVNKGEAGARNTGVTNSKGEYIAFLDDDDEWLPEKLRLEVDVLENSPPETGGVYTGTILTEMASGKTLLSFVPEERGNIYRNLIASNVVGGASTVLLRKECFEKVGLFDQIVGYPVDYDMWIRIAEEFQFEVIGEPLVKYRIHDNNMSDNLEIRIRGWEAFFEKHREFFASNARACSQHYFYLGNQYCLVGKKWKAINAFLKAVKLDPFKIKNHYYLGLSLLGPENFFRVKRWIRNGLTLLGLKKPFKEPVKTW